MGRTIVVEDKIEKELGRLLASQSIQIGLLIGQLTTQRDYVAFCIRTPSLKELGRADGEAVQNLFDDWWVVEHSREVSMLLPGGLSVVGLFLVSPMDLLKSLLPRLRKLLVDITSEKSAMVQLPHPPHHEKTLLHVCLQTKKHKAQTVDLLDPQAGFRPAELKYQSHCSRWHRLDGSITLHLDNYVPTPSEPTIASLHKSIQAALQPTLDGISNSLVALRGRVCQPNDPLVRSSVHRKSQTSPSGETVHAAMYLRQPTASAGDRRVISQPARLRFIGGMRCLAYVHPKATCGEAIAAVKQDAMRSLVHRTELACRDAEAEQVENKEAENTGDDCTPDNSASCKDVFASCQLPRRVMVTIATADLPLLGYCFPNETEEELRSNLGDLLAVEPSDMKIEHIEMFPAPPSQEEVNETASSDPKSKGSLVPVVSLTAAAAMALVAVAVWLVQNMDLNS